MKIVGDRLAVFVTGAATVFGTLCLPGCKDSANTAEATPTVASSPKNTSASSPKKTSNEKRPPAPLPQAPLPLSASVAEADRPKPPVAAELPVDVKALAGLSDVEFDEIRNLIAIESIWSAIGSGSKGLILDLGDLTNLLDGTRVDSAAIYGKAHIGPYPFEAAEAKFAYKRFRRSSTVSGGKTALDVGYLLGIKHNSEDWIDQGTAVVRLELHLSQPGQDRPLGVYDTFVAFRKTDSGYTRLPWIVEGPFVSLSTSDCPSELVIHFLTDTATEAAVILGNGRILSSKEAKEHQVRLTDLKADEDYTYRVRIGDVTTRSYRFHTAPAPGKGPVTLAYCGDSREGVGGGMATYMGINHDILQRHAALAYRQGAQVFLMGGDLVNGYTTSREDFRGQLHAWKQAMSGFWHERPVFPAMGNHEALLKVFRSESGSRIRVDRWPYATDSAEAVFAEAFLNPETGPKVFDSRRPSYRGNVFSFCYGPVKLIAFNNNYWYSDLPKRFGGSPEGFILDDQILWIEEQLAKAERNETVKYVLLYAQEPVFPCGGHIADAMWHLGNNNVRAYTANGGKLHPARDGMLEVRNRLARAVAASSKVAAVLCSDEHSYYRVRIDKETPVGDPARDDKNGDGIIDWLGGEPASPLRDLQRPTWYITCGGGGAPYYSEERVPWNLYWKKQDNPRLGYYYSSQENLLVFHADDQGISLRAWNPHGEKIEEIPDLMAIKNRPDDRAPVAGKDSPPSPTGILRRTR